MEYKYTIPSVPPSNNRFIGRKNIWEYRQAKAGWEHLVAYCCRPRPQKPIVRCDITIRYYFHDRIRRDPDNYSGKMLLDGLRKADIILDDSFNNISLKLEADYDKINPRTEITINERTE